MMLKGILLWVISQGTKCLNTPPAEYSNAIAKVFVCVCVCVLYECSTHIVVYLEITSIRGPQKSPIALSLEAASLGPRVLVPL